MIEDGFISDKGINEELHHLSQSKILPLMNKITNNTIGTSRNKQEK